MPAKVLRKTWSALASRLVRALAMIATCVAVQSGTLSAQSSEPESLKNRMQAFAGARQFRDLDVIRLMSMPEYFSIVQDTLKARHRRFQLAFPASEPVPTDGGFRRFLSDQLGLTDQASLEIFSDAFKLLERRETEDRAVLQLLASVYSFAPRPWTVRSRNVQFGRLEANKAIYYLSEEWTLPMNGGTVLKRFIVEWLKLSDQSGTWVLNSVR